MPILPTNNDMCFFRLAHQWGTKPFRCNSSFPAFAFVSEAAPPLILRAGRALPFPFDWYPRRHASPHIMRLSLGFVLHHAFTPHVRGIFPATSAIFCNFPAIFRDVSNFFVIRVFFLQEMITTHFNWTLTRFFWRPVYSLNYKNNVFFPFLGGEKV